MDSYTYHALFFKAIFMYDIRIIKEHAKIPQKVYKGVV